MKLTKTILLSLGLAAMSAAGVRAQQGQSAAGGQVYGPGGNVSYTIGQADYVTTTGTGGSTSQGIQQPIEIFIISGIEQTDIQLKCAVYPNPASDYVVLSITDPKIEKMSYMLYSLQGKILLSGTIAGSETSIPLSQLQNSVYFIKVLNNNKEVKTFKIIKK